jgi:hypothetical protein
VELPWDRLTALAVLAALEQRLDESCFAVELRQLGQAAQDIREALTAEQETG